MANPQVLLMNLAAATSAFLSHQRESQTHVASSLANLVCCIVPVTPVL